MECPGQPAHWPGAAPKPDKKLANIRNLVGFRSKYTPQAAILCLKYNHYSAKERLLLGQWQGQCSSIQLETFPEKMRRVIVTIPGLGWALVCAAGLSSPELTPYIISSQARPCPGGIFCREIWLRINLEHCQFVNYTFPCNLSTIFE